MMSTVLSCTHEALKHARDMLRSSLKAMEDAKSEITGQRGTSKDEVKACAGMLESIDVYFRVALDKLNDHRGDLLRMMEDTES